MEINIIGLCILVAVVLVVFFSLLLLISHRLHDVSEAIWMQNRLILVLLKQHNVPNVPEDLSELDKEE